MVKTTLKRKVELRNGSSKKRLPKQHTPSPSIHTSDELDDNDNGDKAMAYDIHDDPMIDQSDTPDEEATSDEGDEEPESDGALVNEVNEEEEVEEVEEEEEEEEAEGISRAGPSRAPIKGLYKPPTLDDMDRLRAVESTGGNSFTFQLEALLASTLLPQTPSAALKNLLSAIHSEILSLPSLPAVSPKRAISRLGKNALRFPGPVEFSPLRKGDEVNWKLGWEKPAEVLVGGSWGVCGGYKKGKGVMGGVDMVVIMPPALFTPKDRMSYRYCHKRAHYLAVIYSAIQELAGKEGSPLSGAEISWEDVIGDARRPVLVIQAGKGLKHRLDIRIHASLPPDTFPISTLYPTKSLVRHLSSLPDPDPSPLYSTSILNDTLHKSHLLHLHRLSQQLSPARTVDSYLALWRIWCTRRGIRRERGGSGWFASMVLGWIVDGGEIGGAGGVRESVKKARGLGRGLGYWGYMRAAWEFLAHTDFAKTPIFTKTSNESTIPHAEFTRSFREIFVDPTGLVNIFAEWEQGDIQLLQHHARETLAMLEDPKVDRFEEVFLRDQTLGLATFDEYLQIDISSATSDATVSERSERPSQSNLISTRIATTLRQGLSDRAKLVHVEIKVHSPDILSVGIIFNPEHATRVLEVGPSSQKTAEGDVFRRFWGERAELRRFKDGSIAESVVWDVTRPEEAALIPSRIVKWLLQRHFAVDEDKVRTFSADRGWLNIVQTPPTARDAISQAGSEKLGFRPIQETYDTLYKLLKSIDSDLPLSILNVTPASELLRYSSTFVPHPIDIPRFGSAPDCLKWIPSAEIVLQFESSPRWPDDLAAIQKVKLALMEKLATVIQGQMKGTKVGIVFEQGRSEIEDQAGLEVLLPAGVAFIIRIFHEREKALLERIVQDAIPKFGTSLPQPTRRLAIPALTHHIQRFIHLPQHHSSIAPMHHKYPSYSSATRLLKRWFAAHMLSPHIPIEIIELIMASVYLDPGSKQVPSSATTGFIRAIEILATWDWRTQPILVPIYSAIREGTSASGRVKFPEDKRVEVNAGFENLRSRDGEIGRGAWVIATEEDTSGIRWSEKKPGRVVAGRVGVLARATMEVVHSGVDLGSLNVASLFTTPLDHYDILIHLHPSLVTRYSQSVNPDADLWESSLKYRNIQNGVYGSDVRIDFNPAQSFVDDIQRLYGDTLLVFYDSHGGTTIALLWNPAKSQPRNLKALLGYSSRPNHSDGESSLVILDKEGIVGEIGRLGKGLIERIKVK